MKLTKTTRIAIILTAILLGLLFAAYVLNKPHSSIINYLPYIDGSVFLIVGLYAFLLSFGIYKPKYKTVEQALKVEDLLKRWGKSWKFGSIFMILFGAYNLIWHDPNMYRLNSAIENNKWTSKDKVRLLEIYTKGLSHLDKKQPELINAYCDCVVNNIMSSLGRKEYIDDMNIVKRRAKQCFLPHN